MAALDAAGKCTAPGVRVVLAMISWRQWTGCGALFTVQGKCGAVHAPALTPHAQGVKTAEEVMQVLMARGWEASYPLFTTIYRIAAGLVPPTSLLAYKVGPSRHAPLLWASPCRAAAAAAPLPAPRCNSGTCAPLTLARTVAWPPHRKWPRCRSPRPRRTTCRCAARPAPSRAACPAAWWAARRAAWPAARPAPLTRPSWAQLWLPGGRGTMGCNV